MVIGIARVCSPGLNGVSGTRDVATIRSCPTYPAYRRLWWATGIDSLGNGVFAAALPLLAVTVTRDPREVALVSAATYLPWLLLSLIAGSVVDRVDLTTLMWRTQALQALIVGVLTALVVAGAITVPVLVLLAFALGSCDVFYDNAAQTTLPDLVPEDLLHQANGRQQVAMTVGRQFLGPPLGSLFFALALPSRSRSTPHRSSSLPHFWPGCPDGADTRKARRSSTDFAG
ncbi:MFS transporter [Amycolatopsis sp. WAC 01376]|uniref:MFS transporter n=1 Tax=Amycolatopsis sp. WAC 01376 TaxID=2203195 RepID=UPI002103008E|nr:MFS transporter [Amycolatopsis sp. WAC 01376]